MKYFVILWAFCIPLYAQTALSPRQAQIYGEILSDYDPSRGSARFSSGTDASAPIQFSGTIGSPPSLNLRLLNPHYKAQNPIRRCEIILSGREESRYAFPWNSSNGLMTLEQFTQVESLPAFLLANAGKEQARLVFYGEGGRQLNTIPLKPEENRRVFLALRLYRELAIQKVLG